MLRRYARQWQNRALNSFLDNDDPEMRKYILIAVGICGFLSLLVLAIVLFD
jgi:hypothetical protein